MFLMELPNDQECCVFYVRFSGGGDTRYVNYRIVIGRIFIIFLVLNQLEAVSLCLAYCFTSTGMSCL